MKEGELKVWKYGESAIRVAVQYTEKEKRDLISLKEEGYVPSEVQKKVNEVLKHE